MAATQMQLEDWLDDLCVRFIINLPQEDLSSVARICFQVEEAQWFYEDFIRPLDPTLPSMSLRTFCLRIFQHCPLLASFSVENHTKAFEEFLQYKTRIPVRGAIMLNHSMDSVVLVKGWKKGANWSFPRGKINKDEDDVDCAVREVYEETGLDLQAAGLIPTEKKPKYIEILMREQQLRLYVFRDIPMDTNFQPRTRKEISKIQWYKLSELPAFRKKGAQNQNDSAGPAVNKFYMVAPFLVPLKKWIHSQKKMDEKKVAAGAQHLYVNNYILDDVATTEDDGWGPSHTGPPSHVPAIDTLDGATRELQRLLKMQPPTQGLQSPQQEDKGSALLSILQSSSSRSAESAYPHSQQPRTPLEAILAGPSQPQNPHHHNNLHSVPTHTQMPPPSFSLSADPKAAVWNQIGDPRNAPQRIQPGFDGILSQQQDGSQPVPLHTQQMSQAGQTGLRNGIQQAGQSAQQVHIPHGQPQIFGSDQHQTIMQSSQHPSGQRPASLSGQSLALLNAFKRDSGAARSTPPTQRGGPQTSVDYQQPSGASAPSYASQNRSDNPSHFLGGHARLPSEQTNVSELVGSSVHAPKDQHRSALLGMFRKGSEDTAGSTTAENKLLQQLQSHGPANPHLSMEQLSIQPPATQGLMSMASQGRDSSTVHQQQYTLHHTASKSPFSTSTVQQQPPRILQRGQGFDEFNAGGHGSSPQASPFPSQSGHVLSAPAPNASGEPNRRPDGSRQQKQQLLSLFGKQNSPAGVSPAAGMDRHESSEYGKSRVSSMASRGGETPISPAEQTFLLDYLQSVTNNAGR